RERIQRFLPSGYLDQEQTTASERNRIGAFSLWRPTRLRDDMGGSATHRASRSFKRRFRVARSQSRQWSRARTRTVLGMLTASIAFLLLLVHGAKSSSFVVDSTSLGLLGFVSLPFLSLVVSSFKAGGVELSFRELSVH